MTRRKFNFTLIELLVSMGVFSILLVLSMQFFTSSQKMWTSAERKNAMYSEAKLIMDLISSKIQTIYYTDNMPFKIEFDNQNGQAPKILFASNEKLDARKKDLYKTRFLTFSYNSSDYTLKHLVISDNSDPQFDKLLPPYLEKTGEFTEYNKTLNFLWNIETNSRATAWLQEERNNMILLDNVLGFSIRGYNPNENGQLTLIKKTCTTPPFLLEITLILMEKTAFNHWKTMPEGNSKNDYKQLNSHTFKRNIIISDRYTSNVTQ